VTEIGVYTVLAAGVGSAVFVAGGRPVWHIALLGASAALFIVVLAVISRRAGRPVPVDTTPPAESDAQSDVPPALRDNPDEHAVTRDPPTAQPIALREEYARHNPYTRPSGNTQPIPVVQPSTPSAANPYIDGNPYVQDVSDAPPEPPDTDAGEGVRRGRRRRH
jgi:hypothetical protein